MPGRWWRSSGRGTLPNSSRRASEGSVVLGPSIVCLYACLSVWVFVCLFECLYVCLYACLSVWVFVYLFVCLFVYMNVCIYVCMYVCMFVCMLVCALYFAFLSLLLLLFLLTNLLIGNSSHLWISIAKGRALWLARQMRLAWIYNDREIPRNTKPLTTNATDKMPKHSRMVPAEAEIYDPIMECLHSIWPTCTPPLLTNGTVSP